MNVRLDNTATSYTGDYVIDSHDHSVNTST